MTGTIALTNLGNIANALFNSVTANSTAITALSIGGATVNSTSFAGTANNATNLAGVAAASYQLNSTLAANVATMAANSATFANSSVTNTFTVGTAAYFVSNGSVGIGTASPAASLDVTGTIRSTAAAPFFNLVSGSTDMGGIYSPDTTTVNLLARSGRSLVFMAGGVAERMRITADGAVGIGTSSPAYNLHTVAASEWPIALRTSLNTTTNRAHFLAQRSLGTVASPTAVTTGTNLGGLAIGGYDGANWTNAWNGGAEISAYASQNWTSSARGSLLAFFVTADNATGLTEAMRINSAGNVGIGTGAPATRLHVASTAQTDSVGLLQIESTTAANAVNASLTTKNFSGTSQFMQWENFGVRIGSRILTNSGQGAVIFTAGSDVERMRITAAGDVGIGTSSPVSKLDVFTSSGAIYGRVHSSGTSGSDAAYWQASAGSYLQINITYGNGISYTYSNSLQYWIGTSSNAPVILYTNNAERIRIEAGGNVGIGTSAPTARLDVRGEITNFVGTVGTQRVLQNWGWDNAIPRWKPVIEADASFSLYNYDTVGGSPFRSFFCTNGSGSFTQFSNSVRAPIFIDSNDTNYYVDPNSTSILWTLLHNGGTASFRGGQGVDQCCGNDGAISIGGNSTKPPRIAWHSGGIMEGSMEGNATGWRKIFFFDNQGQGLGVHATGQIASNQNVIAYFSDRRLKKDFVRVTDHWKVLDGIAGYRFTWNEAAAEIPGFMNNVGKREVGLIAQEVNDVYPEAVYTRTEGPEEDPYKTILHDRFTPIFVEALKDLKREIDALKEENAKLKELINER